MNCRSRSQAALPGDAQPLTEPAQKITFAEMRDTGVRETRFLPRSKVCAVPSPPQA